MSSMQAQHMLRPRLSPSSHSRSIEWGQLLLHNNGRSHLASSHHGPIEWGQHHCIIPTKVHTVDQYHLSKVGESDAESALPTNPLVHTARGPSPRTIKV